MFEFLSKNRRPAQNKPVKRLLCGPHDLITEVPDEEIDRAIKSVPMHKAGMYADLNIITTALAAATAKTVGGVLASTNVCLRVLGFAISFDGATSTNVPAKVEICTCTFATNPPGTNSTSLALAKRDTGRPETIQATAGHTWTTEPTVITVLQTKYIGQFNGLWEILVPFATPLIVPGGDGFCIRVTSPNVVNCSGSITVEE